VRSTAILPRGGVKGAPLAAVLRRPAARGASLGVLLATLGCRAAEPAHVTPVPLVPLAPAACSTAPEPPAASVAPAPAPSVEPAIDPAVVSSALARIPTLGTGADADAKALALVQALHVAGRAAVPLLVDELHVVDPERFDDRTMHVVWCVRALRSLTGEDFYFKTTLPLSRRSAGFLDPKRPMGFIAYWMSHATLYVAPPDVQRRVIDAWKAWALARGERFPVQPFVPFGDWFF
jgi:hypothetical protein